MSGKLLAVVTGANKGIGFEIARKLAQSGFKTIVACRNPELGNSAAETLRSEGGDAEFRPLDVSDKESILQFASSLSNDYPALDVLVNNAAIAYKNADPTPFQEQARPTVHTNYFGLLWLTEALLPLMRKSVAQPKIVNVASQAGALRIFKSEEKKSQLLSETLTVDELNIFMQDFVEAVESGNHSKDGWPNTCYGTSKAGVIALTRVLARDEPTILINSCCPGYCATDMSSHKGHKTAEEGARTPFMLATLDDNTITGKFYTEEREIEW